MTDKKKRAVRPFVIMKLVKAVDGKEYWEDVPVSQHIPNGAAGLRAVKKLPEARYRVVQVASEKTVEVVEVPKKEKALVD